MLTCTQSGGSNPGPPRNRLFVDAKLNVGCGEFGWHVEKIPPPPPPKPEVSEEKCHDPALVHEPVMENVQNYWSDTGCGWQKGKADFRADTAAFEWRPADASQFEGGLPFPIDHYRWKIEWIEGCTKFEQQSAWDPVGDGSLTCDVIMKDHLKCKFSFLLAVSLPVQFQSSNLFLSLYGGPLFDKLGANEK